jgi:hypothetical protein
MWEKKDRAGGLNDYGATYTWAGACTGNSALCQPNAAAAAACAAQTGGAIGCGECASGTCIVDPNHIGAATTIWDWINQLNSSTFAGYNDWRVPTVGYHGTTAELETILAAPNPCEGPLRFPCVAEPFNMNCRSECTVTACSCTQSATTNLTQPGAAWEVGFAIGGFGEGAPKTNAFYARAVRTGS